MYNNFKGRYMLEFLCVYLCIHLDVYVLIFLFFLIIWSLASFPSVPQADMVNDMPANNVAGNKLIM